ncbi:MAG: hypothetical protein JSV50_17835 [Desulfobacteraceae bacterium]|nr:MAG: hypothetical protein JSV50_17835 [Desulfobacteraceae bacterium]
MEKIVISSSQPKKEIGLLSLVKALFPECEIEVRSKPQREPPNCSDSSHVQLRVEATGKK